MRSWCFLNYLKERFSSADVTGIEYLQSLLSKAKSDFPHIQFLRGNVLDKTSVNERFDVITMLGVLCIFDDYKQVITNVLSWLRPGGRLILHNMVSEFDVDVFIKYKTASLNVEENEFESGWNIISESSLSMVAEANSAQVISSKPFNLQVDLAKTDDVMRSWTEDNKQGRKDIFNALHVRQPQRIVTIAKT